MSIDILVVDDDPLSLKITTGVLKSAGFNLLAAGSGEEALNLVKTSMPALAVLDVLMPDMDGFELCRRLRRSPETARIPIIILTGLKELDDRLQAYDAGADDFIPKPLEPAEFVARVKALLRRSSTILEPSTSKTDNRTIAVFSLRGGCGVSTVAINLAAGLTQIWEHKTALIDLSLTSGQSALMLDVPLRNSWADLAPIPAPEIETDIIRRVMLRHPSGLDVLATSREPELTENLNKDQVDRVLAVLKTQYEYIVIDLPHDFRDTTLAALDAADMIALLLTPELASIQNASSALRVFDKLDYPAEKIELVLNWTFKGNGLSRAQIEKSLKRPIRGVIPNGGDTFSTAITLGKPVTYAQPESPFAALFEDLAFHWSHPVHKSTAPKSPREGYQRVQARIAKRKEKMS
ncbi:MAG: response regulator [Chloroflexi bacterium]|nr:response regulator [Chloroflexota bacterium]